MGLALQVPLFCFCFKNKTLFAKIANSTSLEDGIKFYNYVKIPHFILVYFSFKAFFKRNEYNFIIISKNF